MIQLTDLDEDQSHPDYKRLFITQCFLSKHFLSKAYSEFLEVIPIELHLYKLNLENLSQEEIRKIFPNYLDELEFWMEKMENIVFYAKYYESKQNHDEFDEIKKLKLYHKLKTYF